MAMVGLPLLALSFTHHPSLIAGVAVAASLPGLVIGLPVGAIIDRLNRRRFLISLQVLRFAVVSCFVVLVATRLDDLAIIYVAAFVLGSLTVAFDCAVAASVPAVVNPDQLVAANARFQTVYRTSQEMVGRALGGVAFTIAHVIPFISQALGYATSLIALPGAVPDTKRKPVANKLFREVLDGFQWFTQNGLIRLLSGTVALLAFCQSIVFALLVLYATEDLHLSQSGYGLLLGITAGGSLIGAAIANRLNTRLGGAWCLSVAGAVVAVTYLVQAATHLVLVAGIALTTEAVAVVVGVIASQSLRQSAAPPEMQGRVAGAHMTLMMGAFPLGSLVGGLLGGAIGIRPTFLLAGCLQLVVVGLTAPALLAQMRRRQPLGISNL
jgi:MFS family permease